MAYAEEITFALACVQTSPPPPSENTRRGDLCTQATFAFKIFSTEKSLIKSGSENDF